MPLKNLLSRSTLLLALVFFGLNPLAQANPPKALSIFPTQENFLGLDEELYPLGWSEDGEKLALLSAHPNEASDERRWTVQILDLVHDKRVLDLEIFHLDEGGFASFWAAHGETVESAIQPFSIVPADFTIAPFPALLGKFRSESYEASLSRTYGIDPLFEYRGLKRIELKLSNLEGKTKTIQTFTREKYFPLGAGVVGYLSNPLGDRIAVIVAFTERGYESAPHVRRLEISGARVGEKF